VSANKRGVIEKVFLQEMPEEIAIYFQN